jgi:HK97 family phage major capsid protein
MIIKELREKQKRILTEARSKLEQIKSDTPEARAKELETQHDAAMQEYDALEKRIKSYEDLEARERQLETDPDPRRPNGENRDRNSNDGATQLDKKEVFKRFIQFGMDGLSLEQRQVVAPLQTNVTPEMRAAGTTSGAVGGFLIPDGFLPEIQKALAVWGPMLDPGVTRVLATNTGNSLPWPTVDDVANVGALLTENTAATEQDITLAQRQLDAFLYTSKIVRVSVQLLQDSAFSMDSLLNELFAERIGRIANQHLTTGTGAGQPNGVVTASGLGKTTAAVAAVTADEFVDFYHSINPAYRASPQFRMMFNDSTLLAIRKLKDSQNRYLIDGLKDTGAVINIAGISVPYVVNQAVASMATGARFAVAGDFGKYITRIVKDFTVLRLVERYAEFMQVGFVAFNRIDGDIADTSAIKYMANA